LTLGSRGGLAVADVPGKINYQGKLTDDLGNPVTLETEVTFALYTQGVGGGAIWSETQTVSVIDGIFNVLLGRLNPLQPDDFSAHPRAYLGVKVGSDAEMSPRPEIVSVAYSLKTAGITVKEGKVGIGTLEPETKLDVAGYVKSEVPAFFARNSSHRTAAQYMAWDTVSHNTGGAYDPSTGRFTAPVDGLYYFCWGGINYPQETVSRSYLYKNGSNYAGNATQLRLDSGAAYGEGGNCAVIPLAAGDWVAIYLGAGGLYSNYGYFTGHLVGAQ
jgi:hypothetical protein